MPVLWTQMKGGRLEGERRLGGHSDLPDTHLVNTSCVLGWSTGVCACGGCKMPPGNPGPTLSELSTQDTAGTAKYKVICVKDSQMAKLL